MVQGGVVCRARKTGGFFMRVKGTGGWVNPREYSCTTSNRRGKGKGKGWYSKAATRHWQRKRINRNSNLVLSAYCWSQMYDGVIVLDFTNFHHETAPLIYNRSRVTESV
jgi:hypothetical protein